MVRALLLPSLFAVFAAGALTGCSDECRGGSDCDPGEYCLQGICTAVNASFVNCVSDEDCRVNKVVSPSFTCQSGRCQVRSTRVVLPAADAAPSDTGSDVGVNPDAAPNPDATPNPDAAPNLDAMSMDATSTTSTTTDAG